LDIDGLVEELRGQGVELWFESEQLRFRSGEGTLSEDQVSKITASAADIVQHLRAQAATQHKSCELSYGQQAIWLVHQLEPESPVHNLTFVARVHGKLNIEAMKSTVQALVDRHEILRTGYANVEGLARQNIAGAGVGVFKVERLFGRTDEEIDAIIHAEHRRPFDLAGGTVFRVSLLARSETDQILIIALHHIAIDGWSYTILLDEFFKLYRERAGGSPALLPRLSVNYSDYCAWQSEMLAGPEGDRLWEYWRSAIPASRKLLDLPLDRPRPAKRSFEGKAVSFVIEPAMSERVRGLARQEGTTAFVILLACFHVLLYKLSGAEEITVGTPALARKKTPYLRIVGDFTNPLPIRGLVNPGMKFSELIRQLHQTVREAMDAQEFPFSLMVQRLQSKRDPSRSPLFDCIFALHRFHKYKEIDQLMYPVYPIEDGDIVELGGLQLSPYPFNLQEGQYDLSMQIIERGGAFRATLKYSTDLFVESSIGRFTTEYADLVDMVTGDPEVDLGSVRPAATDSTSSGQASSAVRVQASDARSATGGSRPRVLPRDEQVHRFTPDAIGRAAPAMAPLHRLFEARVGQMPDAEAVAAGEELLTYRELNARANRLAHALRQKGVQRNDIVGLTVERNADVAIGILAILKTGAAYLPLDPDYPRDRLAFVVGDAKVRLVLASSKVKASLQLEGAECLDIAAAGSGLPDINLDVASLPDDLAYVIYTSGSTGNPKGVLVTHANVARLFSATDPWFSFGPRDVWTLFHSYAFDFSVWELWGALLYGGRLVIVPYWVSRDPAAFRRLLIDERVTILNQTPSAFRQLIQADLDEAPASYALREVIFGGEALVLQSLKPWIERYGDANPRLVNMYGITETTVHVTYRPITRMDVDAGRGSVIGVPIPDLYIRLLDEDGKPVPDGVPGEIWVGGAGVANGYLNRPELTAQRFVTDPLDSSGSARLYRAGDLARRLPDGDLEFLGRADSQVKIRGFRIELGEIETALAAIAGVGQAVVMAREISDDTRLVAYLIARTGVALPPVGELRTALAKRLPDYMVPAAFVPIDALPLTVNGKIDRDALPMPKRIASDDATPLTEIERRLVEIWKDVLGLEAVGRTDDFFELGGHSLLAVRLLNIVETEFGRRVNLASLFESPTIESLAMTVESDDEREFDFRKVVRLYPSSTRPQLFGINNTGAYYQLARQLGPKWPLTALQLFDPSYPADRMPETIEQVAAQYVQLIRQIQPKGPYNLLSWCAGSILTVEVAHQLLAADEKVPFLAIIEGYAPFQYKRFNWLRSKLAVNSFRVQWNLAEFRKVRSGKLSLREFLTNRRSLQAAASRFKFLRASSQEPAAAAYELWLMESYLNSTAKKHQLKTFPGRIHLFRASEMPKGMFLDELNGWSNYAAQGVEASFIEGDHHSVFRPPGVDQLADKISAALAATAEAVEKSSVK